MNIITPRTREVNSGKDFSGIFGKVDKFNVFVL